MASVEAQFLNHYFVGEGFSGFVPAVIGIIQGAGIVSCLNNTPTYENPRFSVQSFFLMLAVMGLW